MTNNALWHIVDEKEKEEIKKDAKQLLTKFAAKIEKISAKEHHQENGTGTRKEGTGWQTDEEFRSTTLANAPLTEKDFIIAEKGAWKK